MALKETSVADSLRERKKRSTLSLLRTTALRLFLERGFASVSVDEIATEANVSRSTFFRYFGSKEAVLFDEFDRSGDIFLKHLRERPTDESPWGAFEQALIATARAAAEGETPDEEQRAISELLRNDPALSGRRLEEISRWTDWIAQIFAERGGRKEPDLDDRVAAATCMAVSEEVGRVWREDPGADPAAVLPEVFRSLRTY
jgi:AcrR family transcriptional regulator